MKKQMLLAAVAGLTLVSAHPASQPAPIEARTGYPPCSRTVTDRCIQLHERGIRAETNLARNAAPATAPLPVRARAPARAEDDIDVSYAGEVLQAPRAGHHPAHARPHHAAPHRPVSGHPARVVVVRENARAHAVTPQAVAHAAHPRPVVLAEASPRAYPPCTAGTTDRCRQHRSTAPRRQYSMRVRRAGERG